MSKDLRGYWKDSNSTYKPRKKQRKPVSATKYRKHALKHFNRTPEATDNHLLSLMVCKEMGWDDPEHRGQVQGILRRFYHSAKQNQPKNPKTEKAFYASKAWKTVRYQALKNSGATCQCCGATAADGVSIHVDHIHPRSKYPKMALDLDNLQVLCSDCNIGKDNVDDTNWRQHWEDI